MSGRIPASSSNNLANPGKFKSVRCQDSSTNLAAIKSSVRPRRLRMRWVAKFKCPRKWQVVCLDNNSNRNPVALEWLVECEVCRWEPTNLKEPFG